MKGSLQIARLFNIPVHLHWSFGLLLIWVIYVGQSEGMSWIGTAWLGLFMLTLFVCVVMHEFGHALTARRFGVETQDIILLPIGGVARLMKLPEKPIHEFLVAIAGPIVNVVIAFVLAVLIFALPNLDFFPVFGTETGALEITAASFPATLLWTNLILAVFNLIPAFPMDGGRILRSLLAIRLKRQKATRIASVVGQILAVLFFVYGFWTGSFITAFIGIFVFFTAASEYRMVKVDSVLEKHTVADLLRTDFTRLQLTDGMALPITRLKQGAERNFLVFDVSEQVVGVLHEQFIMEAIKEQDYSASVAEYMSPKYEAVPTSESLKSVIHKIQDNGYSILPVREAGELLGVIDIHMLNNFLQVQSKSRSGSFFRRPKQSQ